MAELRFAQGCPTSRAPEGPGKVASGWGVGVRGEPSWLLPAPPPLNPGLSIAPPEGCWALSSEGAPASHRPTVKVGHSDTLTVC